MSTYNLTINNSIISGANGFALLITSIQAHYKQCPATLNTSHDFTIVIVNSKFTGNNNDDGAVVSINVLGVKFTTRIIIQSTEMCHNIGVFGLELNLFSYQYQSQFFVALLLTTTVGHIVAVK